MPELAEVEFFRRRWAAGHRQIVLRVDLHPEKRLFRDTDTAALQRCVGGSRLTGSTTHGKQMLFRFSGKGWLGVHLGMTGELRVEPPGFSAGRHDHLVLQQDRRALVFSDPRQFGRVRFHQGADEPEWWRDLPRALTSPTFTLRRLRDYLQRHARAPLKAVLLAQDGFPGVGNWMADEILWRARCGLLRRTTPIPRLHGCSDTAGKRPDVVPNIARRWTGPRSGDARRPGAHAVSRRCLALHRRSLSGCDRPAPFRRV